jgi:hypothetical protein
VIRSPNIHVLIGMSVCVLRVHVSFLSLLNPSTTLSDDAEDAVRSPSQIEDGHCRSSNVGHNATPVLPQVPPLLLPFTSLVQESKFGRRR